MKIAALADIHGNHYALGEVLKSAAGLGVERLLILGDLVGYYYCPDVVLQQLSAWNCTMIKGNHEVLLESLFEDRIDAGELRGKYGSGHEIALRKLDVPTLKRLFSLPTQLDVAIDGVRFQLNHGSPDSVDEYLYPDSPVERLSDCNSPIHDFVLIGHSHYSFSFTCEHSILINCGSVGQSRKKGGIADWAMIDTASLEYRLMHTPYDAAALIDDVKKNDPSNDYSSNVLQR